MNCLGIDFGTTSVKAALFDENLNLLAEHTEDYKLNTAGDRVELPPETYRQLLQNAIEQIKLQGKIHCLSIDTQCETLILTDDKGVPVRDAIVWLDNRATAEADRGPFWPSEGLRSYRSAGSHCHLACLQITVGEK